MAMTRSEKDAEISRLKDLFTEADAALCVDYRGLTVSEITELRSGLRQSGAKAHVVKNTLAKVSIEQALEAAEQSEREKFAALFQGPSFVVFASDDAASPAKVLTKFAKDHEDLELKGGWFEGGYIDVNGIKDLSNLPSREELYAKLLSLLQAPATKVVQLLNAPASKLVQTLEAHRAKLEEKGE